MEQPNSTEPAADWLADDLSLGDEPADDTAAPAPRLAGVGAALGSCFSVMLVVLAVAGTGSISQPRSGRAAETSPAATAVASVEDRLLDAAAADARTAAPTAEQQRELDVLERRAMLARAEVEAAESNLALLRAEVQRQTLSQATHQREAAQKAEASGSPYEWISGNELGSRTREWALTRLQADLADWHEQQRAATAALDDLKAAAEAAEEALRLARASVSGGEAGTAAENRNSAEEPQRAPAAMTPAPDGDLQPLIERHRRRLLAAMGSGDAVR